MNNRVIRNPNFVNMDEFHASLKTKGVGAKDWPNSHSEHEYLGNSKFAASIGVGHKVFFDKADGNKPKKHKLTDERPAKDYILIQGAKCCVEVYPYYAKYFDVQHEEVRLYEERWVVQRLFKEPDTWRDVGAWNPVISVKEYSEPAGDVVKVTVTYDTDYGTLTVEYFQRDGNNLKHNVTFKNTSGSTETFRVLQKWAGIIGNKLNGNSAADRIVVRALTFTFGDDAELFKLCESVGVIGQEGAKDILEMLTGSREPIVEKRDLINKDGLRLFVQDIYSYLELDENPIINSSEHSLSTMIRAVEDCPEDARVFMGGLGLGAILFPLTQSHKVKEIIICEKDNRVIDVVAPLVEEWFGKRYPNLILTIIQGDAIVEVSNHGKFDWIFMDIDVNGLEETSTPNLTERGVYTNWSEPEIMGVTDRVLYFEPVVVDVHPQGLKADFIYSNWVLAQNESLVIDPDTATLDNPTEDGQIEYSSGPTYNRDNSAITVNFGAYDDGRGAWIEDRRGYIEWDISTLAGKTLTANPTFKYHGNLDATSDEEINPITEEAPSGATDVNLYGYIASGTAYVNPWNFTAAANQSQDLGAAAKTDLQTAMTAAQSWWAIGCQSPDDEGSTSGSKHSNFFSEEKTDAPTPKPTLYVEYEAAAAGLENKSAGMAAKMIAGKLI